MDSNKMFFSRSLTAFFLLPYITCLVLVVRSVVNMSINKEPNISQEMQHIGLYWAETNVPLDPAEVITS